MTRILLRLLIAIVAIIVAPTPIFAGEISDAERQQIVDAIDAALDRANRASSALDRARDEHQRRRLLVEYADEQFRIAMASRDRVRDGLTPLASAETAVGDWLAPILGTGVGAGVLGLLGWGVRKKLAGGGVIPSGVSPPPPPPPSAPISGRMAASAAASSGEYNGGRL